MRQAAELSAPPVQVPGAPAGAVKRSDWATLGRLLPYLWQYKWRVGIALSFMVGAKLANIGVPLLLKQLVDGLSPNGGRNLAQAGSAEILQAVLVVPTALLLGYGLLRLSTTLFTELRELVFAKAT
ncbi:MAG: metal ABC transporter permease, partial [Betaproteobacteria bacterium]